MGIVAGRTLLAQHADALLLGQRVRLVGPDHSFARTREDVEAFHVELERRQAQRVGIVLKVENREGFENLSALLLEAMRRPPSA